MATREETIVPVLVASLGANSSSGGPRGFAICRRDEVFYSRWYPVRRIGEPREPVPMQLR